MGTAAVTNTIAVGTDSADVNTATEVHIGSRVNSVYVEFNVAAQTTTNPKVFHWKVIAIPPVSATMSAPTSYFAIDRSFILKRGMEMLPSDVATVFKRMFVVKLGKYRRMLDGGTIALVGQCSSTETINWCGFTIYKELN